MKGILYSTALLLPVSLLCAACVGGEASTVLLNDGVAPGQPVFYGNVSVFTTRSISREVDELGSVCVSTKSELASNEYLILMQKAAATIGADAVVGYEVMDGTAMGVAVRYRASK